MADPEQRQAIPYGYDKPPKFQQRQVNAELNILTGLGYLGLLACVRATHGFGSMETTDTSWKQKRFGHLFASKEFNLKRCVYDPAGRGCSAHAPIITDFLG